MRLLFLLFAHCFINFSYSSTDVCHDYYDHICENKKRVLTPKLKSSANIFHLDVEQHQDYLFENKKTIPLFEAIDPVIISRWLVELHTFLFGVKWDEYNRRHENFIKLGRDEQKIEILEALDKIDLKTISNFYNSLKKSVEHLRSLKIAASRKNPFYHELYEQVKRVVLEDIEKNSRYSSSHKLHLKTQVNESKIYFAYFDYNNLTYWELAKQTYEREYYKLKSEIDSSDLNTAIAEKAIRISALVPALKILTNYMTDFSERFVFQSVIAAPTRDCFNYFKEIHISVLTRIDPNHIKEELAGLVFVIAHELLHSIYNLETKTFEVETWENEKICVITKMKSLSKTDIFKIEDDWNPEELIFEDLANLGAIRILMQYVAKNSYGDEQMRYALERVILSFCSAQKNLMMKVHNPSGVSFNMAIAELPIFKTLYNCSENDRMFVSQNNTCEILSIPQQREHYEVQKVARDDLLILSKYMDILENAAEKFLNESRILENENDSEENLSLSLTDNDNSVEVYSIDDSHELPISKEEYDEVFISSNSTYEPLQPTSGATYFNYLGMTISFLFFFFFFVI